MSLANNHSHDYLANGLEQTKATLKKNDIEYTGLPGQITMRDVQGVRVAVLGFSPYSWNASLLDIPAAQELVRRADRKADVVVVLIHAGAEGADKTHTPTGTEYAFGENRGDSRGVRARASSTPAPTSCSAPVHTWSAASSATRAG